MLISGNDKAYKNMDCQFLGHPVLVKNDDYYTPGIIRFEHCSEQYGLKVGLLNTVNVPCLLSINSFADDR